MSARPFRPLLMIPMLLLGSCAPSDPPPLAVVTPRLASVISEATPKARRAEIRRQLAALCPSPLTDAELERAAQFVETHRSRGAVWIAGRLSRMDDEARICRGAK